MSIENLIRRIRSDPEDEAAIIQVYILSQRYNIKAHNLPSDIVTLIIKLQSKARCSAEECETKRYYGWNEENWDVLTSSIKCRHCKNYFCNLEHEKCPICVGTECDGCPNLVRPDEMIHTQEGMRVYHICSDCYSNMICGHCGVTMAYPGEESEEKVRHGGMCESCAIKGYDDHNWVRCKNCSKVVLEENSENVVFEINDENLSSVCKECQKETFDKCPLCENYVDRIELGYSSDEEGRPVLMCSNCDDEEDENEDDPNQIGLFNG